MRQALYIWAVVQMLGTYPRATMQDVYKSFYQDRFGAEHMISDTAAVRDYLLYELEQAATDTVANPFYEPVGAQGRYVRVYLRCVNEGLLTAEQLLDAFLRSAVPSAQPEQTWADEWQAIVQEVQETNTAIPAEHMTELEQAAQQNRAVRHSEAYRNAYHPHYRIVEKTIFEQELEPLINKHK